MITYDDVQAADISITHRFERAKVDHLVAVANAGFPDSRFKGKPGTAQRGRVLYVLHMLNKPPVDVNAPHIRRQMGTPKPMGLKPHVWDSTEHGRALKRMVKGRVSSAPKGKPAPARLGSRGRMN